MTRAAGPLTTTRWPCTWARATALCPPAYQVTDLDSIAAGGEYLAERGYQRSWGIGRHIQGSQLFDYWRDPDHFMLEHFADGDLFSCDVEAGVGPHVDQRPCPVGTPCHPATSSAPALPTTGPRRHRSPLRGDNEMDPARLLGLLKAATS